MLSESIFTESWVTRSVLFLRLDIDWAVEDIIVPKRNIATINNLDAERSDINLLD